MTYSRLHIVLATTTALIFTACGPSGQEQNAVNWNDINYVKVACSGIYANSPGCKGTEDDDLSAIGKGKGK